MGLISDKKKKADKRFYSDIRDISIPTVVDYIRFSCILHIENREENAALFFKNGKIKDVRLNSVFGTKFLKDVSKWKTGAFTFCEWEHDVETKIEYLQDVFHLSEILESDCELIINSSNKNGKVHIEKGKIISSELNGKIGKLALAEILKLHNGTVVMKTKTKGKNRVESSSETKLIKTKKNNAMNVKKLNASMDTLKEDLGDALIASVIWTSSDGQSLASINPQPKAAALFNQVTGSISKTLTDSGFPGLNRYYLLDLAEGSMILILIFKDHQWGMLVDSSKVQLGLLLNVAMPKAREAFEDALSS